LSFLFDRNYSCNIPEEKGKIQKGIVIRAPAGVVQDRLGGAGGL